MTAGNVETVAVVGAGSPPSGLKVSGRAVHVLAVDPGATGALCLLDTTTGEIEVHDMPVLTVRGKSTVDGYGVGRIIDSWSKHSPVAFVENVGTRPGEGAVGAFSFGRSTGVIVGAVCANFLRLEQPSPSAWKKAMRLGSDKDEARAKAASLFPTQSNLFARKKDHGRADAACLAWFGARELGLVR